MAVRRPVRCLREVLKRDVNRPVGCSHKGKRCRVVPVHTVKAYSGSSYVTSHILDVGAGWRSVVTVTRRALYSQERTPE